MPIEYYTPDPDSNLEKKRRFIDGVPEPAPETPEQKDVKKEEEKVPDVPPEITKENTSGYVVPPERPKAPPSRNKGFI